MNGIVIRDARPTEYEEVGRITVEAYREYAGEMTPDEWETYQADLEAVTSRAEEAETVVAEQDDALVGAVAYFPPGPREIPIFPGEWAGIRVVAVVPGHRKKGIGKLLTEECIARARRDGATALGLYTTQMMMIAKGMYERLGFQLIREFETEAGFRFWAYALPLQEGWDRPIS